MLPIIYTSLFAVFTASVTAYSHSDILPNLAVRQQVPKDCNATCLPFKAIKKACVTPHCGCNTDYFVAQFECLGCSVTSDVDEAAIGTLQETQKRQCAETDNDFNYTPPYSPGAAAIVAQWDRQGAELRRSQRAFLALQIAGGHVGLVIVLAFAVFSRKVRRDPTFLNFCITWIFSSVVFSILLYRGTAGNTIANSLGLVSPTKCLAQAALTNGAQVMTACSTMALVIQLWLGLRAAIHGDLTRGPRQTQWTTYALLVSPYVLFVAFALPSVFLGKQHITIQDTSLQRVLPTNFYCTVVELNPFLQAVYGVTLALLIFTVVFDALIIGVLYRHWWAFRHVQTKSAVSLSILLRVMTFSVYRIVVAVAYGTVLNKPPVIKENGKGASLSVEFGVPTWVDMLQAAIPLVGFLVLGVNTDMVTGLMFWRGRKRRGVSTMHSVQTTGISTVNSNTWNEKAVLEADTKYVHNPV